MKIGAWFTLWYAFDRHCHSPLPPPFALARLVDGATGERNIFKRRGVPSAPPIGQVQRLPKRLRFVVDVSSSMGRFNGADRRLDRTAACIVMVMEAFGSLQHKYDVSIVGHSGESFCIPFVGGGAASVKVEAPGAHSSGAGHKPMPRNRKERLEVIRHIYSHANFAMSGDHTLAAAMSAVEQVTKEDADDYFVFLLSDANLSQYGVSAQNMAAALLGDQRVNSYAIFIAGEEEAEAIRRAMPAGHAHVCLDTAALPAIFKEIFAHSLLKEDAGPPPNNTIRVNNLNEKVKGKVLKNSLRAVFKQFGDILDIVAMDSVRCIAVRHIACSFDHR